MLPYWQALLLISLAMAAVPYHTASLSDSCLVSDVGDDRSCAGASFVSINRKLLPMELEASENAIEPEKRSMALEGRASTKRPWLTLLGRDINAASDVFDNFFQALYDFCERALGRILLGRIAVACAICLVFQYHYRQFCRNKPSQTWKIIGVDILLLNIYYSTQAWPMVKLNRFGSSLAVILFDAALQYHIQPCIDGRMQRKPLEDECEEEVVAQSKYGDITIRFRKVLPLFFVQTALTLLYVDAIKHDPDVYDLKKLSYIYWFIAVLVQKFLAHGDRMGAAFKHEFWTLLFREANLIVQSATGVDSQAEATSHDLLGCVPLRLKTEWGLRRIMDGFVNSVFYSIILYTFPIKLAHQDKPLDFVTSIMAVYFITTLDDSKEAKTLEAMRSELLALNGKSMSQ